MTEELSSPAVAGRSRSLWLGALAILAMALILDWSDSGTAPAPEDWAAVAERIAADVAPGDALWVVPAWAQLDPAFRTEEEGALEELALLTMDRPTVLDLARHRRMWIVSMEADVEGLPGDLDAPQAMGRHGLLHVSRVVLPHRELSLDLGRDLQSADVSRWDASGEPQPCPWRKDRHRCVRNSREMDVRWTWGEVGNTRRKAAFVHAGPDGGRLEIGLAPDTLGAELHVSLGLGLQAVRREAGSDVRVRVSLGEEVLWEQLLERRDFRWYTRRFSLDEGGASRLRFEVFGDDARKRDVFVDAVSF